MYKLQVVTWVSIQQIVYEMQASGTGDLTGRTLELDGTQHSVGPNPIKARVGHITPQHTVEATTNSSVSGKAHLCLDGRLLLRQHQLNVAGA